MPSVRQVAIDLQINPLTASKAYQMLVDDGIVVSERGVGMRIKAGAYQHLLSDERQRFLADEWPKLQARMAQLNISFEDLPMPMIKKASQL